MSFRIKLLILSLFAVFSFQTNSADARWATPQDANIEYVFYNRDIHVKADGKSHAIVEYQVKLLKESGREAFAVQHIHFNENVQKIKILEAKTIYQGQEFAIPEAKIEIKPLASSAQGFDQMFQVLLSFPHAEVGAELYLKFEVVESKQPIPDYYATAFHFGGQGIWQNASMKLTSELPFHVRVNDPNHHLKVQLAKDQPEHVLSVTLEKPIFSAIASEP